MRRPNDPFRGGGYRKQTECAGVGREATNTGGCVAPDQPHLVSLKFIYNEIMFNLITSRRLLHYEIATSFYITRFMHNLHYHRRGSRTGCNFSHTPKLIRNIIRCRHIPNTRTQVRLNTTAHYHHRRAETNTTTQKFCQES